MTESDQPKPLIDIEGVVLDLESAEDVTPAPPDPSEGDHGAPGQADPDGSADLPPGCPVTPLGIREETAYYLDAVRQLRALKFGRHNRLEIMGLFGAKSDKLYEYWPRQKWEGDEDTGRWVTTGWKPELAAENMIAAAHNKGVWDPTDRVRGAGAWRGASGELILHCGDGILIGPAPKGAQPLGDRIQGAWHRPGAVGRYVFPAAPACPRPHPLRTETGAGGPAWDLLELLKTWRWRRGELDAVLLLGWIGAAILGGALHWRPVAWITGGPGTGKSTLHDVLRLVFDQNLVSVSDASAAGIWQKVKYSTLPIALDEVEAEEDNRKSQNIVKLARQAASGGVVLRGGSDHENSEFIARSCFLFSSILHPPFLGQDQSRIAVLSLDRFRQGDVPPALDAAFLGNLGRQLLRALADHWTDFGPVLATYRAELQQRKQTARGADVFGTLLACAHVMLHGAELDSQAVGAMCAKLQAAEADAGDEPQRDEVMMLQRILGYSVEPYRGGARSLLGEWVEKAAGLYEGEDYSRSDAQKIIQGYGIKFQVDKEGKPWLAIAYDHPGLDQVFKGTHWAARSGTIGVWAQAAARLDGAMATTKGGLYFAGVGTKRAVLVPIETVCPHGLEQLRDLFQGNQGGSDDTATP